MQDLLSFVQSKAGRKRENLACEVLTLLLREERGKEALLESGLLGDIDPLEANIDVDSQIKENGCIPDIRITQRGKPIALLELKFDAKLTERQLSGAYFKTALQLVFIVPKKRVDEVRAQVSMQDPRYLPQVLPWDEFFGLLARVLTTPKTREDCLFVGALEHLKEFCNVIEAEKFEPFTVNELRSPIEDESVRHLIWLTRESVAAVEEDSRVTSKEGKPTASVEEYSLFYGKDIFLLDRFEAWLGYWPRAWRLYPTDGPLWIQFRGKGVRSLTASGNFQDGRVIDRTLSFPVFKSVVGVAVTQEDELAAVKQASVNLLERLSTLPPELASVSS